MIYEQDSPERIDKFLSSIHKDYTRSYIQKLIKEGYVKVNHGLVKSNYLLKEGDYIDFKEKEPEVLDIKAEDIPLDIVYEDDDVLVINKARGVVVHPAPGNYSNTLVNAIMFHCKDRLSSINGVIRPGIVHRIDKDTTGLLVVCKTDKAHLSIAKQLKDHSSHRVYEALTYNNIKEDEGLIDVPIGRSPKDRKKMIPNAPRSKNAITHYKVLERLDQNRYTYVSLQLETGRTHQIRVHMGMIGNPLIGDPVYGPLKASFNANGQMLHAKELGFIHPSSGKYIEFSVNPPEDFEHILKVLRQR